MEAVKPNLWWKITFYLTIEFIMLHHQFVFFKSHYDLCCVELDSVRQSA